MAKSISLPSPAKINYFLHIVAKRPDGYHDIESLFQYIDLCDTLDFKLPNIETDDEISLQIKTSNPMLETLPVKDNLVYKAAALLKKSANIRLGIDISLAKVIPIGAGLGGGSSNAATALLALNYLWDINWPQTKLLSLAKQLGADVPFFLYGHAAFAEGIGEQLTAADCPEPWLLIAIPECHVSTPKMYAHPNLTRDTTRLKICSLKAKDYWQHCLSDSQTELRNDFEPVVKECYPEVAEAMKMLSSLDSGLGTVRMSGSGACVFIASTNHDKIQRAAEKINSSFKIVIAKGHNLSPLFLAAKNNGLNLTNWGVAKW